MLKLRLTRETFLVKPNAIEELVQDATRAGLKVEYNPHRGGHYRIEGILVYQTRLYTVGFKRVTELIEARLEDE